VKAVILAAGEGKRLRPLTEFQPKAMVKVRGCSFLERQLQQLKSIGINEIIIVTGYCDHVINVLAKKYEATTIFNERYASTNMVFSLSKVLSTLVPFSEQQILVLYGDIAYSTDNLLTLVNANSPSQITVLGNENWLALWSLRLEAPLSDAETFMFDEDFRLFEIGKKPESYKQVQAQYMGMLKMHESFLWDLLSDYISVDESQEHNNMYMTDLIQKVALKQVVSVVLVKGAWIEMDTIEDYRLYSDPTAGNFNLF
jgi:L-glutamine-phosphate cytidylyltransferase